MSKYQTPCRYDFVGSFLRPQEVKQAKADYAEGKISEEEKDRIIDAAITDVVLLLPFLSDKYPLLMQALHETELRHRSVHVRRLQIPT